MPLTGGISRRGTYEKCLVVVSSVEWLRVGDVLTVCKPSPQEKWQTYFRTWGLWWVGYQSPNEDKTCGYKELDDYFFIFSFSKGHPFRS
jgi:hypothetical protein